jgi:hypothetical protein
MVVVLKYSHSAFPVRFGIYRRWRVHSSIEGHFLVQGVHSLTAPFAFFRLLGLDVLKVRSEELIFIWERGRRGSSRDLWDGDCFSWLSESRPRSWFRNQRLGFLMEIVTLWSANNIFDVGVSPTSFPRPDAGQENSHDPLSLLGIRRLRLSLRKRLGVF